MFSTITLLSLLKNKSWSFSIAYLLRFVLASTIRTLPSPALVYATIFLTYPHKQIINNVPKNTAASLQSTTHSPSNRAEWIIFRRFAVLVIGCWISAMTTWNARLLACLPSCCCCSCKPIFICFDIVSVSECETAHPIRCQVVFHNICLITFLRMHEV